MYAARLSASLAVISLLALAVTEPAQAQSFRGNSVPVQDPTLGGVQGNLAILTGWRGEAHLDRTSDPVSYGIGTLTSDLHSPDGTAEIKMLAVPFHTMGASQGVASMMPGNPAAQRNVRLMRFTSTMDLLRRFILPSLQLGAPVDGHSMPEQLRAQAQTQFGAGTPGAIFDGADVLVHTAKGDVVVVGSTSGGGAGTEREQTTTSIEVFFAPTGKAYDLMQAQNALPPVQQRGDWQQANLRYLADWRHAMEADYARINAQISRDTANIVAMGSANVRAMHDRGLERDRAFAEHEQRTSDLGSNFRGYLSGTSTTYKWCGSSGATYTVDDVRAPGAGFQRCN